MNSNLPKLTASVLKMSHLFEMDSKATESSQHAEAACRLAVEVNLEA